MILAAMVALLAVVAVPAALAQSRSFDNNDRFQERFGHNFNNDFFNRFDNNAAVDQSFDQEIGGTGDVDMSLGVSQSGNSSNQCVAPMQFGNTGNLQNSQGFLQYGSQADDVQFEGSGFVFAPQQGVQCSQSVEQSSAASSY